MTELEEKLSAARDEFRRYEYVARVKTVLAEGISAIDPAAEIVDTQYYNHSAIPDFEVKWRDSKQSRDVFLRGDYGAILASDDLTVVSRRDPIFISLETAQDTSDGDFDISPQILAAAPRNARFTLLTDVAAVGEMAVAPQEITDPLSDLVRSNFIRGAKGFIDEGRADELTSPLAASNAASLTDLLAESFFPDAVHRMERTAALVEWALSATNGVTDLSDLKLEGTLSTTELRSLLPWLLKLDNRPEEVDFWRAFGTLTSLRDVESISDSLVGVDLTPLITANADQWTASRVYLGLSISEGGSEAGGSTWSIAGNVLELHHKERAVRLSNDGRSLKARPGEQSVAWDIARDVLTDFAVDTVQLSGIVRSLRFESNSGADLLEDVDKTVASLEDTYFLESAGLVVPSPEPEGDALKVAVSVDQSLAIASKPAPIAVMTRVALRVLAAKNPTSEAEVEALFPVGDAVLPSPAVDAVDHDGAPAD